MNKKIIKTLFHYASQEKAATVVIEDRAEEIGLDYRLLDGSKKSFSLPKKLEDNLINNLRQVLKVAPGELLTKKYCKIYDQNYHLAFYLTILPNKNGERLIINIIHQEQKLWRLEQLGFQRSSLLYLQKLEKIHSGLILVSAPIGQGKSATLNALAQKLNNPQHNLYFFDKYPNIKMPGINYLALNQKNWETVLRHDCEAIILPEINDEDTLKKALLAASTGRLVLGALSADSVWEVLLKIFKLKLPLKLKLDGTKIIINQRLVPLKNSAGRQPGRRQLIGLFETLNLNSEMKKFILKEGASAKKDNFWEKLTSLALNTDFKPLQYDLQKKIRDGLVAKEEHL